MTAVERSKRFKDAREKYNVHGAEGLRSVSEKTGISQSLIWDLEAISVDRAVSYQTIAKLAEYYSVNVAWLLGQSDSWSLDRDSQVATETTGLSTDAVEILSRTREQKPDLLKLLNMLLTHEAFWRSLRLLEYAQEISRNNYQSAETAQMIESLDRGLLSGGMKPDAGRWSNRQMIRAYLYDATQMMTEAFRAIAPDEKKG